MPAFEIGDVYDELEDTILSRFFGRQKIISYLSHYTSVEAANSILANNSVWMSNSLQLNDYEEYRIGFDVTLDLFLQIVSELDLSSNQLIGAVVENYKKIKSQIQKEIYCISFSVHDRNGDPPDSLEMWDRYGDQGRGVAMVFRSANLLLPQRTNDPIFWLPMTYHSAKTFEDDFKEFSDYFLSYFDLTYSRTSKEALRNKDIELVHNISRILVVYAMLYKNRAYSGERELRLVYCPALKAADDESIAIQDRVVRGSERRVAIVELSRYVSANKIGIDLNDILESVILGPRFSDANYKSLTSVLTRFNKVNIERSKIPYR